jgi:hypothetical protein
VHGPRALEAFLALVDNIGNRADDYDDGEHNETNSDDQRHAAFSTLSRPRDEKADLKRIADERQDPAETAYRRCVVSSTWRRAAIRTG